MSSQLRWDFAMHQSKPSPARVYSRYASCPSCSSSNRPVWTSCCAFCFFQNMSCYRCSSAAVDGENSIDDG